MHMLLTLCFALLLLTGGCVAPSFVFNPDRVERYLETNQDVGPEIAAALRRGQPVKGMTKKEVKICLGTPSEKIVKNDGGLQKETWLYARDRYASGELRGSPLWSSDIPLAKVVFGNDETVVSWREYSGKVAAPAENQEGKARSRDGSKTSVPKSPAPQRRFPAKPFDEDNFKGWPRLTVNGTSSGVAQPSAVINETAVLAGETVVGAKVISIEPKGVTLEYGGSVQFLPVGKSTR
jgi:hypothetical protein